MFSFYFDTYYNGNVLGRFIKKNERLNKKIAQVSVVPLLIDFNQAEEIKNVLNFLSFYAHLE